MVRNENNPFSEMSFHSPIWGPLDLILDTFISTDDNRSRCEPFVSLSSHKSCKPLSDCSNRNSETLLRVRDVSEIRPLQLKVLRVEQVLIP